MALTGQCSVKLQAISTATGGGGTPIFGLNPPSATNRKRWRAAQHEAR